MKYCRGENGISVESYIFKIHYLEMEDCEDDKIRNNNNVYADAFHFIKRTTMSGPNRTEPRMMGNCTMHKHKKTITHYFLPCVH